MTQKQDENTEIKILKAKVGNHEVQIAEYSQIVKELSDKLKLYESKYGTVFRPARNISNQK